MAKKSQGRVKKRSRPAAKRDLVPRPKASAYAKLDILVLMDAPVFPGSVVPSRATKRSRAQPTHGND